MGKMEVATPALHSRFLQEQLCYKFQPVIVDTDSSDLVYSGTHLKFPGQVGEGAAR